MSQNSQGAMSLATTLAIGIFLVAFACLWTLGDFSLLPAIFLAAVIALIAWIVLYIGLGRPSGDDATSATSQTSEPAATAAKSAAPAAATATTSDADRAAEAAEAKRAADAEAAERAAAEETRRKAEAEEAAEAKRKADADAEAKRKSEADAADAKRAADAADAKRAADAAEAKEKAEQAEAARASAALAETTPDYDGDGVHEGVNEGTRPTGLDAPRDGQADDLKQIKGIGAKMEALCNRLGFWHFDQIASWTDDEVAWVDANLEGFKGRVTRDAWVDQAKVLASGGETEFSKRVEGGEVY